MRSLRRCLILAAALALGAIGVPAAHSAPAVDALVSVASPPTTTRGTPRTNPRWPSTPPRPDVLAAGANDLVDMQPCSRQASTTAAACSFPLGTFNLGVGLAVCTSRSTAGHTWTQPTYCGLTAADCSPTVEPCTPHVGPIHTVPNYYENGLRSRSDPGVAFGPAAGQRTVLLGQRLRLYYPTWPPTSPTPASAPQRSTADTEVDRLVHRQRHRRPDRGPGELVAGRSSSPRTPPQRPAWTRSRSGRTTPRPARSSATCTSATPTSTASAGATRFPLFP